MQPSCRGFSSLRPDVWVFYYFDFESCRHRCKNNKNVNKQLKNIKFAWVLFSRKKILIFFLYTYLELVLLTFVKSFRRRACKDLARLRSMGRGLHTSQRYSSGMLFLSRPIHTTCCHTLLRKKNVNLFMMEIFFIVNNKLPSIFYNGPGPGYIEK